MGNADLYQRLKEIADLIQDARLLAPTYDQYDALLKVGIKVKEAMHALLPQESE